MQNLTLEEMIADLGNYPKEQSYQESIIQKAQKNNNFHKNLAKSKKTLKLKP